MAIRNFKQWGRAVVMLPLAMAATQVSGFSQGTALPSASAHQEAGTWTFHHEHVLGTSLEVRVQAPSLAEARRAEAAALGEFDRQERLLSAWRPDSEFSRWAATRFEAVKVSPELMRTLAGFDRWREATGGALDPSAEAAIRLWKQAAAEGRRPTQAEIAGVREAIAQPHWALNQDEGTATRLSDVPLALASFAKSAVTADAASAAMRHGARGVMLNVGGDVVVRGDLRQVVEIANPRADAENDLALDRVAVTDRAVATSGSYRRGIDGLAGTLGVASHIVDPRTAEPTGHVLSSTVIAKDAATAGALATAFSVLSPAESAALADRTPGVDYLLVTADGRQIASTGWAGYQAPGLRPAAFVAGPKAAPAAAGMWDPAFELTLAFDLPKIEDARYRRPYVAAWIEDADHFPVRTLALWVENPRWLPELKNWYRDDQVRNLSEGTDISKTVTSATRPPGHYTLKWDGRDNSGKPVKVGKYTVVVEASREHGGYTVERRELDFNGKAQQATLTGGQELGAVALDYRKR